MEVKATVKFVRMSPRKVRLVIDVVRGMKVAEAQSQLKFMNKAAARPVLKLIDSAVANAVHNFNLKAEDLVVKTIMADGGPTIKRWKPRAHGRAFPIRKRTSHILVELSDGKDEVKEKKEVKSQKSKVKSTEIKKPVAEKPVAKKTPAKKPAAKKTPKQTSKK